MTSLSCGDIFLIGVFLATVLIPPELFMRLPEPPSWPLCCFIFGVARLATLSVAVGLGGFYMLLYDLRHQRYYAFGVVTTISAS